MKTFSIFFFSSVSSQLQLSYINKISNAIGNHNARRRPLTITLSDPLTSQEEELFQKIISFDNSYRKHIENFKKAKSIALLRKPDIRQTMRSKFMAYLRN